MVVIFLAHNCAVIILARFFFLNVDKLSRSEKVFVFPWLFLLSHAQIRLKSDDEKIVSIEKVLNLRCSSDSGPRKSHFGTFNNKHPPEAVIDYIFSCLDIPMFSGGKLMHWCENGYLFLGFENPKDPYTQRLLHIESGVQHEAVYLSCKPTESEPASIIKA